MSIIRDFLTLPEARNRDASQLCYASLPNTLSGGPLADWDADTVSLLISQ